MTACIIDKMMLAGALILHIKLKWRMWYDPINLFELLEHHSFQVICLDGISFWNSYPDLQLVWIMVKNITGIWKYHDMNVIIIENC